MVRRGSYRIGDVGFVYPKDLQSIYTKKLQVFRVIKENPCGITQNNLLVLLNMKIVQEQIKNIVFLDTTLPKLSKRWRRIKLPLYNLTEMKKLSEQMENCYNLRLDFWDKMSKEIDQWSI